MFLGIVGRAWNGFYLNSLANAALNNVRKTNQRI